MENVRNDKKERQKRRILILVPLILVPLLALCFWSLGGGRSSGEHSNGEAVKTGLRFELPKASLDDSPKDKLSYYDKAKADSLRRQEALRNDPYYSIRDTIKASVGFPNELKFRPGYSNDGKLSQGYPDQNEARVYERLNNLQNILSDNQGLTKQESNNIPPKSGLESADIDRLERLLAMSKENQVSNETDPENQELNSMLDKVLDIQYPERVKERLKKKSQENKGKIFTVSTNQGALPISVLQAEKGKNAVAGFFSLEDPKETENDSQNNITAVIHETQTAVSGSILKLRLTSDIYIDGIHIPKDHFVFGIASLQGERLMVTIENIRYKDYIFPVNLAVFGTDGINGIHIPGAISRDVAKQSSSDVIQSFGNGATTIDPSLSVQAATAGIELGKTLLSKKVKLIKVTVKSGYQVLLKDMNEKGN